MHYRTSIRALLQLTALAAGLAACDGGDDGRRKPSGNAPKIEAFAANPMTVLPGGSTTLSYKVSNATSVKIETDSGMSVLPESSQLEGEIVSEALSMSTTFTLTAAGPNDETTASVTVTVEDTTKEATILSFTATPLTVDAGQMSTLSWTTENGTEARIDAGGATVHTVPEGEVGAGTFAVTVNQTTAYTLYVRDADGNEVSSTVTVMVNQVAGPSVTSFTANPTAVDPGMSATLSWTVADATQITIADGVGTNVYMGADLTGTVQVTPAQTTTYTLVASDGAQMASGTVTVTVNQPPGASVDSFTAAPPTITAGQVSTLSWTVSNAPDGIEISDGTTVIYTSTLAAGTYDVTPAATTTYELTAINNQNGNDSATVTVTVNVPQGPAITSFTATPPAVGVGGNTALAWTTVNATQVRILDGATELYNTTTDVAAGTYQATVAQTTTYTLEATDGAQTVTQDLTVTAEPAPVINTFTVAPQQLTAAGNVDVTWDVSDATTLTLTQNGTAVAGFPGGATGTMQVNVTQNSLFELTATSAGGTANQQVQVTIQAGNAETEPNDTIQNANVFANGGLITGSIGVAGDVDIFQVTVPDGGNVTAETSDGAGGCNFDTVILLLDDQGNGIAIDDDGGVTPCSRLDAESTPGARNLAAGTYYVQVTDYDGTATGNYQLSISIGAPACGDGFIDLRVEDCDDGNTTAGDGCDAACGAENPIALPAGTPATVTGTVAEIVRIDVTGELYISATSGSPTVGTCNGSGVILTLYDEVGGLLGWDESTGPCESFADAVSFSRATTGTYFLVIQSNVAGEAFEVQVDSVAVNASSPQVEAEANNDQANANVSGLSGAGTVTVQGQTLPDGDDDVFSFVVPANQTLMFTARTYDTPGDPTSCTQNSGRTDTRIFLEAEGTEATDPGTGELAFNEDIDASSWCSEIPATAVTAGAQDTTFYVRVQGYQHSGYRHYLMDITLQ